MTRFHRSISRFPTFSHFTTLRWLPVFAALAAVSVPSSANAARASGAYNGTWNVVFATTRGNCSSGYSVPFQVTGTRVSSAGGGRVSGTPPCPCWPSSASRSRSPIAPVSRR